VGRDRDKYDEKDRKFVMLIKSLVIDEMLPKVQKGTTSLVIWKHLKDLHETSDKGRAFFPKSMIFSMMMNEHASLQEYFLEIKDI
jgi:hypothetical protein